MGWRGGGRGSIIALGKKMDVYTGVRDGVY